MMLIASMFTFQISSAQSSNNVFVYGVDFTHAKAYAVSETPEQFSKAFEGINLLIITEPEKYDFSQVFGARVTVEIEPMVKLTEAHDFADLKTLSHTYDEPDYAAIVKSYTLPQTEGTGTILVAKMLDKPNATATYEFITFDIATREIIIQKEVVTKALGFGLRNYWARTVYNAIKQTRVY